MTKPIFRIFVSSTYIDLIDYRKAAEKAINDLNQKFIGMEYMGALSKEPKNACLKLIEECDLFIGIYAWRYGFIPENSEKSITQQEYEHALTKKKPILCYFVDEDYFWKPKMIEKGTVAEKLESFKKSIDKKLVRASFQDTDDLKYKLVRDIGNWHIENQPKPNNMDKREFQENKPLDW